MMRSMSPPIARPRAVFDLRPGEGAMSAWAAIAFFAIMSAYFLLRPLRDAAGIDGDPAFIPWLWTVTAAVMLAIAAPWGALVARVPRRKLVPISFRVFLVQLLGFVALFAAGWEPLVVGRVFYVWLSVFNLFVVSVFWSVCTDLARPEQGRRLFGPIAVGGTAGAILGPLVTRSLATRVDPWVLMAIAAALLEAAVWAMAMVDRHGARLVATGAAVADAPATRDVEERRAARALGGHPLAGVANVVRSPYLAGIAAYAVCAACLATFVYLTQAEIAKAALPDRATRTRFFADVDLWTGLATIGLQAFATSRLLRWLGAGLVLAALPLVQGAGLVGLVAAPSLAMATAVSASGRAVTHALSRPAREVLFTAVGRQDRFKTKNVIDTLVYRLGDTGASWLHRGLVAAGVALTAVALPLAGAWIALALALGLGHRRRTAPATAHTSLLPAATARPRA
jgi:AAA family ATP:ADP antiporter